MNSKSLFYFGIVLIITPFLGVYLFLKAAIIIAIGVFMVVKSIKLDRQNKAPEVVKEDSVSTRRPLVRRNAVSLPKQDIIK